MKNSIIKITTKGILILSIMFSSLLVKAQSYTVSSFTQGMSALASYNTTLWNGSTSSYDDSYTASLQNIGFTFNYFGSDYTQFSASTNGWISLSSVTSSTYSNTALPTTSAPNNTIAPWWDDLEVSNFGVTDKVGYSLTGSSPNRILTVEWNSVSDASDDATYYGYHSFQIKLYETTNVIEFHYHTSNFWEDSSPTGTIGIENADGTEGIYTPSTGSPNISTWPTSNYRFTPVVISNMAYSSSTTTQNVISPVNTSDTNREIIGLQIVTTGASTPISATSFSFNTTGTDNPTTNISNAKLWSTGTSSTFATTTQIGSTVVSPNGTFTITGTDVLETGTNYLWLTYDIQSGATVGNVVDAQCTAITVAGTSRTPSVTNPTGTRTIQSIYLINQHTTITACSGTVYDTGGPTGDYGNSENQYVTITSATPGGQVQLNIAYVTESGFDKLSVYNGTTTINLLGTYSGTGSITLTSTNGSLHLVWISDGSAIYSGFSAVISCIAPVPITYTSSTTTQTVTTVVQKGSTNNQIIGLQIITTGDIDPIDVTQFNFTTLGSTNALTDITNAKLWSTGASSTFATNTQVGTTSVSPNGSFTVTGSRTLLTGTNYFWLTYDINSSSTINNVVDAQCTAITIDGLSRLPSVTNPTGTRLIASTPGADCSNPNIIATVPYSASATTCGFANDYDYTDACGSSYMNGEDRVYSYTPSADINVTIALTNTAVFTGVFVLDGCPDGGGTCVASDVSADGNPSIAGVDLVAGTTYYIIISTWPTPDCTAYDIDISINLPATEHDCFAAEPVCQNVATVTALEGISGGNYNELPSGQRGCLSMGEHSTTWYVFTAQTDGSLTLTINATVDIDWAIYDISGSSNPCQEILDGTLNMVRCNYSAYPGATGLNLTSTNISMDGTNNASAAWCQYINAVAGNRYILVVDRFTSGTQTYTVNFADGGGTSNIVDNSPPSLVDVVTPIECGASSIQFEMSEYIQCSSVDAAFFTLTGPSSTVYSITGVSGAGIGCSSSGYDQNFVLNVSPAITETGSFTLNFNGSITDICNQAATASSKTFTITGIGANTISSSNPTCPDATDGSFEVVGIDGTSPYSYDISGTPQLSGEYTDLSAGTFDVSVTDFRGCSFVQTITLIAPASLNAGTISGTQTICDNTIPTGFTGTAATTGSGTPTYIWEYSTDNGITWNVIPGATTQNYQYPSEISGVATVLVRRKATDNCTFEYSNSITITITPTVDVAGTITGETAVCPGETGVVYSIDPVNGATVYTWTVPSGASITAGQNTTSITVNWGSATSGNISVEGSNTCFTGASNSLSVIVATNVGAAGTISGTTSVCEGATENYTVTAVTGASNYAWTIPTGASIISGQGTNSIEVDMGTASGGTISVLPSNSCGAGTSNSITITIIPTIGNAGTITGDNTICFGHFNDTYSISAVSGANNYTWTVPSGASITSGQGTTSIVVDFGNATSGNIGVTPSNSCGSGIASTISITFTPQLASTGAITGSNTICFGHSGDAYSVAAVTGATNYTWTVPSGATILTGLNSTSITVNWGTATSGNITVTPSNGCFTGTASSLVMTITPALGSTGAISGNTPVCYGLTGEVYSITAVTGATNYNWTVPAGASITSGSGTNSITVNWGTATSGNITVTPTNTCFTGTTESLSITITPAIGTTGSISGTSPVCYGLSGGIYTTPVVAGATTYTWTVPTNASIASGQGSNSLEVDFGTAVSGSITVTASNSCFTSSTSSKIITITPSVEAPVFTSPSTTLCDNAPDETYTATASNNTGITYSISPAGAGAINATTGLVDWNNTFTGDATVTATATGCNGPLETDVVVTISSCDCTAEISGASTVCTGTPETLTTTGTWSETIITTDYSWSTGASVDNISVNSADNYCVTVTYHNGGMSCEATQCKPVTLTPALGSTNAVSGDNSVCYGESGVIYSTTSVTNATSYAWTVPVGAIITGGNGTLSITVDWGTATSGNVSVVPSNVCFTGNSSSLAVTVTPTVENAGVISGSQTICYGHSSDTYSIDAVTGANNYQWTVPAGATITSGQGGLSIDVNWLTATGGNIVVTPSNSCFTGNNSSLAITITPLVISGTVSGLSPVCYGEMGVVYTLTGGSGATGYTWSVPSGASIASGQGTTSLTVNWGTATSGDIRVVPNNTCFSGTQSSLPVTVTPQVSAAGTITGNNSVCYGVNGITYSISAVSGATGYTWTVPSGATISGGQNTTLITVNWGNATSGNITVTPSNSCGSGAISSRAITVIPIVGNAGTITGDNTICYGITGENYTISAVTGASTYTWTVPSGATITNGQGSTTITVNWGTASGGSISVLPSNTCGDGGSSSLPITITPQVAAAGIINGNATVCRGVTGEVYFVNAVSGATTYTWTVPSGASIVSGQTTNSITVNWGTASTGSITVTPSNTCFAGTSSSLAMTITPNVNSAGTISGNDLICFGTTGEVYSISNVTGATTYNWTVPVGASIISGHGTNSITVNWGTSNGGNVTVTPSNSCFSGASNSLLVTITPTVNAAGSITGNTTVCYGILGQTYSISTVTGATNYTWSVPSGATIVSGQGTTSITVNFGTATSGNISVTPSNTCFNGTASTEPITIVPQVNTPGSITGDNTICYGVSEVYSIGNVSGATIYTWTVPSGASITGGQGTTSINVDFGTATSGSIVVIPSNSCGNGGSSSLSIIITPTVNPAGAITGNDTVCYNAIGESYSIAAVTGANNYTWTVPSGANIASGQGTRTITVNWGTATNGVISVTPSNGCFSGTVNSISVIVTPEIGVTGNITGNSPVCYGTASGTYSTTTVTGATNYTWTVPSGASITSGQGTTSIVVNWGTATTGNITVTPSNHCFTGTQKSISITVTPTVGAPVFTNGASVLCDDAPNETYVATSTNSTSITYSISSVAAGVINNSTGVVDWNPAFYGPVTVRAEAFGCNGPVTTDFNVTINVCDCNAVITGPLEVCSGSSISLAASGNWPGHAGATVSYLWDTPASTQNIDVTTAGRYTVIVSFDEGGGSTCENTTYRDITIVPWIAPTQAITGSNTICYGASGLIYSTTALSGATSYNWTVPSGATITGGQNSTSITVDMGTATTGTISMYPTNSCFTGTTSNFSLTITPVVDAAGTISGEDTVCYGHSGDIYSISAVSGATGYLWTVPTGASIASGQNSTSITVDWGTTTSGNITVTPKNNCFDGASSSFAITITPSIGTAGSISGNQTICFGDTVNYSISAVNNATGYTWTVPSGASIIAGQNSTSITVDWGTATSGNITVTATNSCFNSNMVSYPVTISPLVNAAGIISGPATVCFDVIKTYSINPVTGATGYTWTVPSGSSIVSGQGTTSISVDFGTALSGSITVTPNNSCFDGLESELIITITPNVGTVGIITGDNTICYGENGVSYYINSVSGATSYTWTLPNGASITSTQADTLIVVDWGTALSGNITVYASNTCFTSNTSSMPVAITPSIGTAGLISGNNPVCYGVTNQVYNISPVLNATNYVWTVPVGATITAGQNTTSIIVDWGTVTSGSITVTASNSCFTSNTSSLLMTITGELGVSGTITGLTPVCYGASESYSIANVTNATTYTWTVTTGATISSGQGTNSVVVDWGTVLNGTISVRPSNTCFTGANVSKPITIIPVIGNSTSINGSLTVCYGETNINYTTPVVTGANNYAWTVPANASIISGDGTNSILVDFGTATTGNITVTPSNSCGTGNPASISITITPTVGLPIFTAGSIALCQDSPNETYTATATNNTGISYTIFPAIAGTINSITGVVNWSAAFVGTATITASADGCNGPRATEVSVDINTCDCTANIVGGNEICYGDTDTLTTSGAWPNHIATSKSYVWGDGSTGSELEITTSGNYCVTITYNDGAASCSRSDCNSISEVPTLAATGVITGPTTICEGATAQSYFIADVVGATYYTWVLPAGASFSGSGQGTTHISVNWGSAVSDTITVTPSNNCFTGTVGFLPITITPASEDAGPIIGDQTVCENSTIEYSINQVENATSYIWDLGPSDATLYPVDDTTITVVWGSTQGTISVTPSSCIAGTSSSIFVSITPAAVTPNTPGGDISICQGTDITNYFTNTQNASVNFNWTLSDPSAGTVSSTTNSANVNWNSSFSGTVYVQVYAVGCNGTVGPGYKEVTILPAPEPIITGDSTFACTNSSGIHYQTNNNAANTYGWSITGNGNIATGQNTSAITINWTGVGSSTVSVTETNPANCSTTNDLPITIYGSHSSVISSSANVSCNGFANGNAIVTPTGGTLPYTFTWDDTNSTDIANVTGLDIGTYNVTVKDHNGCETVNAITITEPDAISTIHHTTNATCNMLNGVANVEVIGGTTPYTYNWTFYSESSNILENVSSGNYEVEIIDNHGCILVDTLIIGETGGPTAAITDSTSISCFGYSDGSATVTPTGGTAPYSYLWDYGLGIDSVVNNIASSLIGVTVTDDNGCTATSSVYLVNPQLLEVSLVVSDSISCFGYDDGVITANTTGGTGAYSYTWTTGGIASANSYINLEADITYTVTATDINGCTATDDIILTSPDKIEFAVETVEASCGQGTGSAFVTTVAGGDGNYTYEWSSGENSDTASGLAPDTYTIIVSDGNNCHSDTITINIANTPGPTINSGTITNVNCYGGSDGSITTNVISGTSPFTYSWSHSSITSSSASSLSAGSYVVSVVDANGCPAESDSIFVTQPAAISITMTVQHNLCFGDSNGSISIEITGGTPDYSYVWDNGSGDTTLITNLSNRSYSVEVTDSHGCTGSKTKQITSPASAVSVTISGINATCYGLNNGEATVIATGGTSPYSYLWSDNQTDETAYYLYSGTYYVTVTDTNNCDITDSIYITQPVSMYMEYVAINPSCIDGVDGRIYILDSTIVGGTPPYTYDWDVNSISGVSEISSLSEGTYYLTITDANNCEKLDTMELISDNFECLEIPTAITPNGDGINDVWEIKHLDLYPGATVEVYNRWGEIIYNGTNLNVWDGTYNGKDVPVGSYIFIVNLNNGYEEKKGIITIIR